MEAQSDRKELRDRASAVPLIGQSATDHLLNETESSAMEYDLDSLGSDTMRRIRLTADMVYTEVTPELVTGDDELHFIVNKDQLKGLIHKAVRRGATQALYDSGAVLKESQALEELVFTEGQGDQPEAI